jgi:hypothetical protein
MSSGLQVEKIDKMQDVKEVQSTSETSLRVGNGRQAEAQSTLEPGVDSVRSQGGPFIRGNELEAAHSGASRAFPDVKADLQSTSISIGVGNGDAAELQSSLSSEIWRGHKDSEDDGAKILGSPQSDRRELPALSIGSEGKRGEIIR